MSADTASPRTGRALVQSGKQFVHDRSHVRELSVPANYPCPVRAHTQSVARFVPIYEQATAAATSADYPQTVRIRVEAVRVNQRRIMCRRSSRQCLARPVALCAPHCTRRPAPGVLPLDSAHGELF